MIPVPANAEFLRFGSIHRNSYVNTPAALSPHLAPRDGPTTLVARLLRGRDAVLGAAPSSAAPVASAHVPAGAA